MKIFRSLFVLLSLGVIISSCQKDFSFEAGNAKGNIVKDGNGDCTAFNVQGPYQVGAVLTNASYVDIQIDITKVGLYVVKTDTINGYSFTASGSTAVLGLNTIRLIASGKPIALATNTFTVKFDGGLCEFDVTVTPFVVTAAVFTFSGPTGACSGAVQSGTYTSGVAMDPATNFITIPVSVATIGTYNVSSTTVNGVTFSSGPGSFAAAGSTTIILRASGTPAISPTPVTSTGYDIVATNTCSFSITYAATPAAATFTLNCAGATFIGTYQVGIAISGNTVTIPITGVTAGSYNITAGPVNGISLSGSGVLNASSTSIVLTASGTPATGANPSTSIPITAGGSSCSVSIIVAAGAGSPTTFIQANINGSPTLTTFNVGAAGTITSSMGINTFSVTGNNNGTGSESIIFDVTSFSAITNGTYSVNAFIPFVTGTYTDATNIDWDDATDGSVHPAPAFTITITSLAGNRAVGTFSGRLYENNGAGPLLKTFTNGSFNVPY